MRAEKDAKNAINGFIGGTTGSRYADLNGELLVNATVIAGASPTSRSPAALVPRTGRTLLTALSSIKLAYNSMSIGMQVLIVDREVRLYNLENTLVYEKIFTLDTVPQEKPLAVDTFDSVVISVDGVGYVIKSDKTITKITGAGWAYPSSLDFVDGYVVLSVKNSRSFLRSELNGTAFTDILNFTYIMGGSGNMVNLAVINRELYLFAERHVEVWWNSGATADQPFTRQDGRVFPYGIISKNTVVVEGVGYNACTSDNMTGVFGWGASPVKISVDAVDFALESAHTVRITTSVEANRRYIHVVINEKDVWTYDVLSQVWHKRTNIMPVDYFRIDKQYGLATSAGLYTITGRTDDGVDITSSRTSGHIMDRGMRVFHTLLEFDFGGDIASVKLDHSDDGGTTWRNSLFPRTSKIGDYNRYRFERLGYARDRVYRLSWANSSLYSALLVVEGGSK